MLNHFQYLPFLLYTESSDEYFLGNKIIKSNSTVKSDTDSNFEKKTGQFKNSMSANLHFQQD